MIIWLNGPFGAGKTTVARLLVAADPALVPFDPEQIGYLLRPALAQRVPVGDFQDWRAWRTLTAATLAALHDELAAGISSDLLVPQTVIVQRYWIEICEDLAARQVPVRAFTLDVHEAEHRRRVDADPLERGAAGWRHERRADYDAARGWLGAVSEMIDTTPLSAEQVAPRIRSSLDRRRFDPTTTADR